MECLAPEQAKVYREEVKQIESIAEKLATERIATYLYQQMATTDKQVKREGRQVSGSIAKMPKSPSSWKGTETVTLTRAKLAKLLASHKLEEHLVEIEVSDPESASRDSTRGSRWLWLMMVSSVTAGLKDSPLGSARGRSASRKQGAS